MQKIFVLEDQAKGLDLIQSMTQIVFGKESVINHKSKIKSIEEGELAEYDIAFIDLRLPDGLSYEVIRQCKEINPDAPVIVTTLYAEDEMVFNALKAGADGYLLKSDGKDRLVQCLERILDGEPPISPQIARKLMTQFDSNVQKFYRSNNDENAEENGKLQNNISLAELSNRENEVLVLIARGLVTKEIARQLDLSAHTINDIVKAIYRKLNINTRAQAAVVYLHKQNS